MLKYDYSVSITSTFHDGVIVRSLEYVLVIDELVGWGIFNLVVEFLIQIVLDVRCCIYRT